MLKCSATPGASLENFSVYLLSISGGMEPRRSSLSLAIASTEERVSICGPTRRPTWASVTARLPRLVTVPDTVTVSPSVGAEGVSESTATATELEPESARAAVASRACAGEAADIWTRPVSNGAPASSAAVRRSHRRAGEALVPWKSAASATRSPVPRRDQWSSECASTHGNDVRRREVPRSTPQDPLRERGSLYVPL